MGSGAGGATLVGGGAWLIVVAAVCGGATAGTGEADAVCGVRRATTTVGVVLGVDGAAGLGVLATVGARTTAVGATGGAGQATVADGAGLLLACAVARGWAVGTAATGVTPDGGGVGDGGVDNAI
jgi:hypothetical protein